MTARRRDDRLVLGWREWVHLPDLLGAHPIKAKIDTGARTSAIHAWDPSVFSRDGHDWIRFSLHPMQYDDVDVVEAEARLVDLRPVRSSNGETEERPVVETTLDLGGVRHSIELTLTNRDEMGFRMLLGRTAMAGHALVDPSRSWLLGGNRHGPAAAGTGGER